MKKLIESKIAGFKMQNRGDRVGDPEKPGPSASFRDLPRSGKLQFCL